MLQFVNGKLEFPKYKVVYNQRGEQLESYTSDKSWWEAFEKMWSHTEIIRFEDVEFSPEQKERLSELENAGEGYSHLVEQYALHGLFPDELPEENGYMKDHPFKQLQLEKQQRFVGQQNTAIEIENFMLKGQVQALGQQVTGLEIQLLMKDMEG